MLEAEARHMRDAVVGGARARLHSSCSHRATKQSDVDETKDNHIMVLGILITGRSRDVFPQQPQIIKFPAVIFPGLREFGTMLPPDDEGGRF
jgi:hypothetical protein